MANFPKPKYCGQNWSDMKPTDGGRICGKCTKTIVDFTDMRWGEIEALQAEHNNSLCGRYAPKQLEYWGKEIPKRGFPFKSAFAASSLLVALGMVPPQKAEAQNLDSIQTVVDSSLMNMEVASDEESPVDIIIKGRVLDLDTMPVPGAMIIIEGSTNGAFSDENGNYRITITERLSEIRQTSLKVSYTFYLDTHISLSGLNAGENELHISFKEINENVDVFYISHKPSFFQRITRPFRRLFRKKNRRKKK